MSVSPQQDFVQWTETLYFAMIIFSLARLCYIKRNVRCDEPTSVLLLAPAGVFIRWEAANPTRCRRFSLTHAPSCNRRSQILHAIKGRRIQAKMQLCVNRGKQECGIREWFISGASATLGMYLSITDKQGWTQQDQFIKIRTSIAQLLTVLFLLQSQNRPLHGPAAPEHTLRPAWTLHDRWRDKTHSAAAHPEDPAPLQQPQTQPQNAALVSALQLSGRCLWSGVQPMGRPCRMDNKKKISDESVINMRTV